MSMSEPIYLVEEMVAPAGAGNFISRMAGMIKTNPLESAALAGVSGVGGYLAGKFVVAPLTNKLTKKVKARLAKEDEEAGDHGEMLISADEALDSATKEIQRLTKVIEGLEKKIEARNEKAKAEKASK